MAGLLLPTTEETQDTTLTRANGTPVITSLGLIGGEVLTHLEARGATTLRELVRHLGWPSRFVMMAVGALIRQGLVRAMEHELDIVIHPRETGSEQFEPSGT